MKKFHVFLVIIVAITISACKTNRMKPSYVDKCPNWDKRPTYSVNYRN